ncbi:MAG: membrane protein [Thermodesulfobacteriota bacterium]|nr:MAG: membrane protein [Thermodesulfobacteriota bacterium]
MVLNVIILLTVAALWAFTFIFVKVEESDITPITIMSGRAIIAFFGILLVTLITKQDLSGHLKDWWKFVFFAVFGTAVLWVFLGLGQEEVSAGLASVMPTLAPLLTFVILVLILREEPFSTLGLIGLIIGIVGIVLVVGIHEVMSGGGTAKGFLLILLGFAFFAINGIMVGKWAKNIHPLVTSTYFLFFAALILTALAFIFESPTKLPWTVDNYLEELALGIFCTGAGYYGYYYLIHRAGAYFSSFIFYFIPIFGMVAGYLLLKEDYTLLQMAGVPIVFFGVYLINREKFKKGG